MISKFLDKKIRFGSFSVKVEIFGLLLILLFAFFIRVSYIDNAPFWIDESISSLASLNILEKGVPVFDSGEFYSRALVFHYTQSISFFVFGVNDFSARFVSVLFGLLTVLLGYLFVCEMFSESEKKSSYALFCALVLSVFFLEVFFSRQARFYQLFQLAFFSCLYFLYKSRWNTSSVYYAVVCFVVALDTQIAGIILAPFVLYSLIFSGLRIDYKKISNKLNILGILVVLIYGFYRFLGIFNVSTGSVELASSYAVDYLSFFYNSGFVLILGLLGVVWFIFRDKRFLFYLVLPTLIFFVLIIFVEQFAFRYFYPLFFFLLLFFSVFFCLLSEKFSSKFLLLGVVFLVLVSNIVFPYNYASVILPVRGSFNDYSAPVIDIKSIPLDLKESMINSTVGTFYPCFFEWYVKKPDFVVPYSMDGRNINPKEIEVYSGVKYTIQPPTGEYYFVKDYFSYFKFKDKTLVDKFFSNCEKVYTNSTLEIYYCHK